MFGFKYYLRSWGGACHDMQMKINGKTYYFGSDSKMVTDQMINGNYYGKDGALTTTPPQETTTKPIPTGTQKTTTKQKTPPEPKPTPTPNQTFLIPYTFRYPEPVLNSYTNRVTNANTGANRLCNKC